MNSGGVGRSQIHEKYNEFHLLRGVLAARLCRLSSERTGCGNRSKRGCFSLFSAECR